MLNDNLDKYIKENLENAHVDWDKNAMWDDIEVQLPAKEKDRKGFLFLMGILFLIISALVGYFVVSGNSNDDSDIAIVQNKISINSISKEIESTDTQDFSNLIKSENKAEALKSEVTKIRDVNTKSELSINNNTLVDRHIVQDRINSRVENKSDQKTKETTALIDDITAVTTVSKAHVSNSNEELLIKENSTELLLSQIEFIDKVGYKNLLIPNREIPESLPALSVIKINRTTNVGMQLSIYTGVGVANRTLQSQSNESLLELREQNEKVLEALHGGLKLRKNISHNFFMDAGIEYQRINEKLDYTESSQSTVSVTSDSAYVAGTNSGSLQYFSGIVNGTVTRSQRFIRYNAHHRINIPLHIGYNTSLSHKLKASAYVGPVLNLYQDYKGYNINLDGLIVQTDAIDGDNLLNAFDTGLSLEYGVGRSLGLSFGASYRRALSTFSIDRNVNQSYDNLNLQVGILFNFY